MTALVEWECVWSRMERPFDSSVYTGLQQALVKLHEYRTDPRLSRGELEAATEAVRACEAMLATPCDLAAAVEPTEAVPEHWSETPMVELPKAHEPAPIPSREIPPPPVEAPALEVPCEPGPGPLIACGPPAVMRWTY